MAVRGMAPLRPAELLIAAYQLSFDADAGVKSAAVAAPASLPDNIILSPLGEPLPPQVLHFFAERMPVTRHQALEKILYNPATADETFVLFAKTLDDRWLEIIFQNEVRLLRCPTIVETLYFNKHARMSSVTRALELCARTTCARMGFRGLPRLSRRLRTIRMQPCRPPPTRFSRRCSPKLNRWRWSRHRLTSPRRQRFRTLNRSKKKKKGSASFIKFDELKIFEKIRLATIGNAYCRSVLIRDSNRLVAMSVIRSPSISDMEVVAAAANRAVCDDVIRFIFEQPRVHQGLRDKQALVNNPECPLASCWPAEFPCPDDLKSWRVREMCRGHWRPQPRTTSNA